MDTIKYNLLGIWKINDVLLRHPFIDGPDSGSERTSETKGFVRRK